MPQILKRMRSFVRRFVGSSGDPMGEGGLREALLAVPVVPHCRVLVSQPQGAVYVCVWPTFLPCLWCS